MYYNIDSALSYNALFTMVVGGRGVGKTYSAKVRVIKDFINKGEQFVYLRRYKPELKKISQFFKDVAPEFPEHSFKASSSGLFIDDKQAGFVMTLTTQVIEKSTPYPKVTCIIFDEFLIDPKTPYHYLPEDVETFLECYSTVSRDRDIKAIFLANNVSMYNPYFMYFKLYLKYGETKCRKGDVILLMIRDEEYEQHMENTRFGKIIKGTNYGNYAISNISLRDNNEFLEKKRGNAFYYFGFYYNGEFYGVWEDDEQSIFFISSDYDPYCKLKFTMTMSDHSPNTILLSTLKGEPCWKLALILFKQGKIRFESGKCKAAWLGVMKMVNEVRV